MSYGERISKLRSNKKITQKELATNTNSRATNK